MKEKTWMDNLSKRMTKAIDKKKKAIEEKPLPKKTRKTIARSGTLSFEEAQDEVRNLAYLKWEAAESPDGGSDYFWLEAEMELFGGPPRESGYPYFWETEVGFKLASTKLSEMINDPSL